MCKIFFDNKSTEVINLPSILHDPVVRSSISSNINNFDIPQLSINQRKPFTPQYLMSNLDVDKFLQDNTILTCNCEGSEFKHKHILTLVI